MTDKATQPSPYGDMPTMTYEEMAAELEKMQRRYQQEAADNIALRAEIKKLASPDDDQFRRAIYERGRKDLAEYYESHLTEISKGFDGMIPEDIFDGLPGRWAVAQIALALRDFLDAAGGKNFVVRSFGAKGEYLITVQKRTGITPEELLMKVLADLGRRPSQPIVKDEQGIERYRENKVVMTLFKESGFDMNRLAEMGFSDEDRSQFAQLIGYSVSGYGDLDYAQNVARDTSYVDRCLDLESKLSKVTEERDQLKLGIDASHEIATKANDENFRLRGEVEGQSNLLDAAQVLRATIFKFFQSQGRVSLEAAQQLEEAKTKLLELMPELREIK